MPRQTPKRTLDLEFPVGGYHRGAAYRRQPPWATGDCLNVWPDDPITGRSRGGSRPGLVKAYDTQLGSGAKVNLLAPCSYVGVDNWDVFMDVFDGESLSDYWSAASWLSAAPAILPLSSAAVSTTNQNLGAVLAAQDVNTSSAYEIAIWISPFAGEHWGTYSIFGRMNATTPVATTDGFVATLTATGTAGAYSGSLIAYKAGVAGSTHTFTIASTGQADSGWFKVLVNGNNVSASWLGTSILSATDISSELGGSAGARVGFGLNATVASGLCLVDAFRQQFINSGFRRAPRTVIYAAANGALSVEGARDLGTVSTSVTLSTTEPLEAVDMLQKLYVADYSEAEIRVTGATVSGTTVTITGVTTGNTNIYDHVLELTSPTGPTAGTYQLASVASGSVTVTSAPGNGTATARIARSLKVADPVAGTFTKVTPSAGNIPVGARHLAAYRGRLCAAVGNICYQSKIDDPTDWDVSATGADAAQFTTAADSDSGQIGDIFTALIPFKEDYLIYGCEKSIWRQVGDIGLGGEIVNVTHDYGIKRHGWCHLPGGRVAFLAQDGLYVWNPTDNFPVNVSSDALPTALHDINTRTTKIAMGYDLANEGIHIYVSSVTAADRLHWFVKLYKGEGGMQAAFWPMDLIDNHEPFRVCGYSGDLLPWNTLMLGCRDGYVRRYEPTSDYDDDNAITSYVTYGPVRPQGEYNDMRLDEMVCTLAEDSDSVTWAVRVGESREDAALSSTTFPSAATGTFTEGRNLHVRPRARGGAFTVKLTGGGQRWSIESLTAVVSTLGMQRK